MPRRIDITGQRFGRLTVLKRTVNYSKNSVWLCRCECGRTKMVQFGHLRNQLIRSCGCLQRELLINGGPRLTHGARRFHNSTREYNSWCNMLARCYNNNHHKYHLYGALGVKACKRWRSSFENFLADMGPRPKGKTLDRHPNPYGDYEPDNCRWATPKEQAQNKRARHR